MFSRREECSLVLVTLPSASAALKRSSRSPAAPAQARLPSLVPCPRKAQVIDRKPAIDSSSKEGAKPAKVVGDIAFKAVRFAYSSRVDNDGVPIPVFEDFNLTIPAGKSVALVGESGGGADTLPPFALMWLCSVALRFRASVGARSNRAGPRSNRRQEHGGPARDAVL